MEQKAKNKTKQSKKQNQKPLAESLYIKKRSFSAILRYQRDKIPGSQFMLATFLERGK